MPPDVCAIAFKEWAGICEAIAAGRQSLILRKGGIEEGPRGFAPEHPAFWLYPTFVHESDQGLKAAARSTAPAGPGLVAIDTLVIVEDVHRVDDLDTLLGLDALHAWTEETVRKRFAYRSPGLWVLGVRAFRTPTPRAIAVTPAQLGCKSWVPLEAPLPTEGATPVLTDRLAAEDRAGRLEALGLASGRPAS